jgi:hypothetical protein
MPNDEERRNNECPNDEGPRDSASGRILGGFVIWALALGILSSFVIPTAALAKARG